MFRTIAKIQAFIGTTYHPKHIPGGLLSKKRRLFFRRVLRTLSLWAGMLPLAYIVKAYLSYSRNQNSEIHFPADAISPKINYKNGVFLVHEKDATYALKATCTHLGCEVVFDQNKNQFRCPCHGSRYSIEGAVLRRPAKHSLARLSFVKTEKGDYSVSTSD